MRRYFIHTIDNMQDKFEAMLNQGKKERQLLLDIIKLEQKEVRPTSNVTFTEPAQFQYADDEERAQTPSQDQSSLSIQIDTIDENTAIYKYEINMNRKTIEDMQVKLINLTAELEVSLNIFHNRFKSIKKKS